MRKIKKLLTIFMVCLSMLMAGCFQEKNEESALAENKSFRVTKNENAIEVFANREIEGLRYELSEIIGENEIIINSDKLMILTHQDGKTLISISKKTGAIKNGEKLFKIITGKNVKVKEIEIRTDKEIRNIKKAITRANVSEKLLGDFNKDGIVDNIDFNVFTEKYNSKQGDGIYGIQYDISMGIKGVSFGWEEIYSFCTPDGVVDLLDFIIFSRNYGKTIPVYGTILGGSGISTANQVIESIENGIPYYIVIGMSTSSDLKYNTNSSSFLTNNGGNGDIYIAKLDANKNLIWQNLIGGTGKDEGISVTTINGGGGYVIACNSTSPKINTINKPVNGSSWVYYAKIDLNGNIIGQAPDWYYDRYVTKIEKTISGKGYLSIGYVKKSDIISTVGIITMLDNSFSKKSELQLNYYRSGGIITDSMNLILLPNMFKAITPIVEPDNTISYAVAGNMTDNTNGKAAIIMMKFTESNSILSIKNMQAGKPYIFFEDFQSQESTSIIPDNSLTNKGGFIIGGRGIDKYTQTECGLIGKIKSDGFVSISKLDTNIEGIFNSIVNKSDIEIIGAGSYKNNCNMNYISKIKNDTYDLNRKYGYGCGGINNSIIKSIQNNQAFYIVAGSICNAKTGNDQICVSKIDGDLNLIK